MICKICGQPILDIQEKTQFPCFVLNKSDILYFFNDSVFHKQCFESNTLRHKCLAVYEEFNKKIKIKRCGICKRNIVSPDDYIFIGCLSSNKNNDDSKYNFTSYHKGCLRTSSVAKIKVNGCSLSELIT